MSRPKSQPQPQPQPQHAPEPWRYLTNEGDTRGIIADGSGGPPGTWLMECRNTFQSDKFEPSLRRAVACVNAMPRVELLLRLIGTDNPEGLQDIRNLRDEIYAILHPGLKRNAK